MTHRNTWKARERQIARFFGAERTPLSGGNSRISRSDSTHTELFIETKFKKKFSVVTLWDDVSAKAKLENKTPMVCLAEKNRDGFWLMMHSDDFEKIYNIYLQDKITK